MIVKVQSKLKQEARDPIMLLKKSNDFQNGYGKKPTPNYLNLAGKSSPMMRKGTLAKPLE
jgi:hypothetical protein